MHPLSLLGHYSSPAFAGAVLLVYRTRPSTLGRVYLWLLPCGQTAPCREIYVLGRRHRWTFVAA